MFRKRLTMIGIIIFLSACQSSQQTTKNTELPVDPTPALETSAVNVEVPGPTSSPTPLSIATATFTIPVATSTATPQHTATPESTSTFNRERL